MPNLKTKSQNKKPVGYMSAYGAAEYLAKHLKERTVNLWYGYLMQNARKYMEQDGYRVCSSVVDGKLCFTESSLKAFIKAMGPAHRRREVEVLLDQVDQKSNTTKKSPKKKIL